MRSQIFDRIDDVPAALWEAAAPADFFFQRAFLRVLEQSAVEAARYRYVVLCEGAAAEGLAVLSAFTLRLDLLSGDAWIGRLRRLFPRCLDVPMICCGIPASFGQHHLHVLRDEWRAAALQQVHACMEAWAEERRCGLLAWKEWSPSHGMREHARAQGYVVVPTLPDHTLERLPASVELFLASLRSSYRRKYRSAAALLQGPGPLWTAGDLRLEECAFDAALAGPFYDGYRHVMERTRVRLETYPQAFFEGLARSGLDVRSLSLANRRNGQRLTALLIPSGPVLSFVLVAKERARYDEALYTVLLQSLVLYAIRRGFRELRLGQTSSYAKCSIGARPRRLEVFIRMRAALKQRALERFGGLLFPEVPEPRAHVFRQGAVSRPAPAEGEELPC